MSYLVYRYVYISDGGFISTTVPCEPSTNIYIHSIEKLNISPSVFSIYIYATQDSRVKQYIT